MKKLICMVMVLCCVVLLVSCSTHSSTTFTFNVENGDKIDVKCDTTNGYSMTAESPFEIKKDGEVVSNGCFILEDQYADYYKAVQEDERATIIREDSKDGNKYLFWEFKGEDHNEWNYVLVVEGSASGILLSSTVSKECAEEVFNVLSLSVHE